MNFENIIELLTLFVLIWISYLVYDFTYRLRRIKYLYFFWESSKLNQVPLLDEPIRYNHVIRYEVEFINLSGVNLSHIICWIKFSTQAEILEINSKCKQGVNIIKTKTIKSAVSSIEIHNVNKGESFKIFIDVANGNPSELKVISCSSGIDYINKKIDKASWYLTIINLLKKLSESFKVTEKYRPEIVSGIFVLAASFIPIFYNSVKSESGIENNNGWRLI